MRIYLLEDNPIQMGRLEEAVAHELKSFGKDLYNLLYKFIVISQPQL